MWRWPDLERLSEGVPLPPVRANFIEGVPEDEPWALPTYPTVQEVLESLTAGKSRRAVKYLRSGLRGLQEFLKTPTVDATLEVLIFGSLVPLAEMAKYYRHYLVGGILPVRTVNRRLGAIRTVLKLTSISRERPLFLKLHTAAPISGL